MARAVRQARMRVIPAEGKIRVSRIIDRPATTALRELEQRAALRALDWRLDGWRLRVHQAQEWALGKKPRAPVAWRAIPRRPARGPPRRQAEAMDFADDGIAGDADLVGDLTAGQSRIDKSSELLNPLLGPGCDDHDMAP